MATDLPTARVSRWVPPAPGMMPRLISGWPKLRRLGGDDQVARQGQLAAAAQAVAADRGNDGLLDAGHRVPVADEGAAHHAHDGGVGHLLDVGAGGEGLLAAGDHDATDALVLVERRQGVHHFIHQGRVEGVERLRPVELDDADATLLTLENVGIFVLSHSILYAGTNSSSACQTTGSYAGISQRTGRSSRSPNA